MANGSYTVLTVDDSRLIRRNVRSMLTEIKVKNILEAANGEEAITVLKANKVDLIISDWNMPNMNGQELLEFVRKNPATTSVPFIMLTAEGDKEKVLAALQAGVTNYIVKPFTAETLYKKLRKYLPRDLQAGAGFGGVDWQK
ncbi:MAG: response regulator [Pseudomonadota bacterium]